MIVSFQGNGKDIYIQPPDTAGSVVIVNSETSMGIAGSTSVSSNIATCTESNPCTASIGNVCTAASSDKRGVVCSLPPCPTIVAGDDWNEWSASCLFSSTGQSGKYDVLLGTTVKLKKSSSMSGELVIDRRATSGYGNLHFDVWGTLEMEDVTLTGGYHTVSFFVLLVLL